jgi:hypothetical protein
VRVHAYKHSKYLVSASVTATDKNLDLLTLAGVLWSESLESGIQGFCSLLTVDYDLVNVSSAETRCYPRNELSCMSDTCQCCVEEYLNQSKAFVLGKGPLVWLRQK